MCVYENARSSDGRKYLRWDGPPFSSEAKESRFVLGGRSCISQLSLRVTTSVLGILPPDCISQPRPLLTSSHSLADIFLDCQTPTLPAAEFSFSQHTHLPVLAA